MSEGFYGYPNIGCVALNEFKNSASFNVFKNTYQEGDRIFFIGSIFGGTGAAGLPLLISSIRDLGNAQNQDRGRNACATAPIGALVVMPYFSITEKGGKDQNAQIKQLDFIRKTRSALGYYETHLNQYINRIYYIADPKGTEPFPNDPGRGGQSGNKAHIVEFAGALAMFDFLKERQGDLLSKENGGRIVASRELAKDYTKNYTLLTKQNNIHFNGIDKTSNGWIMEPLMKFYILQDYMKHKFKDKLNEPYASRKIPKLEKTICENRDLDTFFSKFNDWMSEMMRHGATAHNFNPIQIQKNVQNFRESFYYFPDTTTTLFRRNYNINDTDIVGTLNTAANDVGDLPDNSQMQRWFAVANIGLDNLMKKYNTSNLK